MNTDIEFNHDPLSAARGIFTGVVIGCALWPVVFFLGSAILSALAGAL